MPSYNLGRRYERLLFVSAPISLVSLVILFIAIATTSQEEHSKALCYENIANILEDNKSKLNATWEASKPIIENFSWGENYRTEISNTVIYSHQSTSCFFTFLDQIHERYRASPSDIISKYKQDAVELNKKPLELYDVEIPDKTTINVLGTNIKVGLMTFTRVAQLVLAPVIILWLGSLYNTQYRESRLIGLSQNISDNFPHLINMYPSLDIPDLRKPNWFAYHIPIIFSFFFAFIRVGLLMVFIAPPVIAYEWGLLLLAFDRYATLSIVIGLLVGWFALILVILEFLPWHFKKIYQGAPLDASRY